jgi:hypothetical protein
MAASGAVLFLAACTPPLPPDVLAARLERTITCVPGTQDIAVSSDYFEAIAAVDVALNGLCPDQRINPVNSDEPAKVRVTEGPPSAQEIDEFTQQCGAPALITPVFGTPIVVAFNIFGLEGLILTPDAVAGILDGSITNWQDPRIAEPNEGFEIPDIPVELLRLEGPSGAVEAMTAWLAAEAPDSWSQGEIDTLTVGEPFSDYSALLGRMTGTSFDDFDEEFLDDPFLDDDFADDSFDESDPLDESFDFDDLLEEDFGEDILVDDDVVIDLEADVGLDEVEGEGAVAVMPLFYANNNVIPAADLPAQSSLISAANVDLAKVGIAATNVTVDDAGHLIASHAVGGVPVEGQFDIASAKVVLEEGQEEVGWPVIAMSSIMVCDAPNDPLPLSTGQFFMRLGGQGTLDSVGLTPLPEPIRINTLPAMKVQLDSADGIDLDEDEVLEPQDLDVQPQE